MWEMEADQHLAGTCSPARNLGQHFEPTAAVSSRPWWRTRCSGCRRMRTSRHLSRLTELAHRSDPQPADRSGYR